MAGPDDIGLRKRFLRLAARSAAAGLDRLEDTLFKGGAASGAASGGASAPSPDADVPFDADAPFDSAAGPRVWSGGEPPRQPHGFEPPRQPHGWSADPTGLQDMQLMKAQNRGAVPGTTAADPIPGEPTDEAQAIQWDPFALVEQLGYKEKPTAITYGTLRAMVWRLPILRAIIKTRVDQVSAFCVPQQPPQDPGYRMRLRETSRSPQTYELKEMRRLEEWLLTSGVVMEDRRERHGLEYVARQLIEDTLTFDQLNLEMVSDRRGRPCQFYAVDPTTIRFVDSAKLGPNHSMDDPYCVQIYDNVVIQEFTRRQMVFGVRNPRSDIRSHGYGTAESEMMTNTITYLLWGLDYNGRQFCTSGDTLVTTRAGLVPIERLAAASSPLGARFDSWNGYAWREASAVATGMRPAVRTKLFNGLELTTSPEHRFRVIPARSLDGEPEWRAQAELQPDDFLLVDGARNDCDEDLALLHVGLRVESGRNRAHEDFTPSADLVRDPEFWEMLGFALCDGHWPDYMAGGNGPLQIFYEQGNATSSRDDGLAARFLGVCARHGITAEQRDKAPAGVRGHAASTTFIAHKAFVRWLYALGFRSSAEGKRVPAVLFQCPAAVREAFLRGVFSADGHRAQHVTGYSTPTFATRNDRLCQDVLRLLWSVGVAANEIGSGWARAGRIHAQDIGAFTARIGYLQSYKNAGIERAAQSAERWDQLHPAVSVRFARAVQQGPTWSSLAATDRAMIGKAAQWKVRLSRGRLLRLAEQAGVEVPDWLQLCQVQIDVLDAEPIEHVPMFDVEVFDDEHQFLANGVAVHNSQGSVAKGLLNIKGAIPERHLRAFRRQWYELVSGVENAWRTPIVNAEDLEWIDLNKSNRDMEFTAWMDFLIKIACFPAGTRVLMADGSSRPIEDVRPGDHVISGHGRVCRVANTQQRHYSGPLVRFKTPYGADFWCTPNHKLRAVEGHTTYHGRRAFGVVEDRAAEDFTFKAGTDKSRQDYLVVPRLQIDSRPWTIELAKPLPNGLSALDVDAELARWLGVFVAEGSTNGDNASIVSLDFGADEPSLVEFVVDVARRRFGLQADVARQPTAVRVSFNCTALGRTLRELFGPRAVVKPLPEAVLYLPTEAAHAFILGLFDGDAHVSPWDIELNTASRTLADQVRTLCLRLWGPTGFEECVRKTGFVPGSTYFSVTVGAAYAHAFVGLFGAKGDAARQLAEQTTGRTLAFDLGEAGWALKPRLCATSDVEFDGTVYNFEVEGDHSYIIENLVSVRNCAIFSMDPIEVNFKYGGQGQKAMFEAANKVKIVESKAKGLQPLLKFLARIFNENVVWPNTEDFAFEFSGLSPMTPKELADLETMKVRTYMMVDEIRAQHDLPPIPDGLGQIIDSPNWMEARRESLLQAQLAADAGGGEAAPAAGSDASPASAPSPAPPATKPAADMPGSTPPATASSAPMSKALPSGLASALPSGLASASTTWDIRL